MTGERSDTGTSAHLHRGELYRRARRITQLAGIIQDCTSSHRGGATDLIRAEKLMQEIAAISGLEGEE